MTHSRHSRTRAIAACFAFVLFFGAEGLHAQEPWPSSPLVPPDTTHYNISMEYGAISSQRRPPDSLIIPGTLLIRFRHGALDSNTLSHTYWEYFYGHNAKKKGGELPLSGPYDDVNQPRGYYPALRQLLFAEQFGFDSTDNIVKDSSLKHFFLSDGCHYLHRLTAASPLDTLSVTRDGDTIGCDHMDWMLLEMDSTTNPLLLCGLLMAEFPRDIIEAYPDYGGTVLLGHVPGNANWECQVSDTMINAPLAWDYEVGDTNILVALWDRGIDYRHPGFLDAVVGQGHKFVFTWDYDNDTAASYVSRITDHGTACAALVGLPTNRGDSIPGGVAGGWGPLAGGSDTIDRGRGVSLAAVVSGFGAVPGYVRAVFEASARNPSSPYGLGAHVINTSADFSYGFGYASPVHDAVNYAFENGVVQTAARSHNTADTLGGVPAGYDPSWIISVGASLQDKSLSPGCSFGETLDLLAPSGNNAYGNCGPPNLNWTARVKDTTPPIYYYGGESGSSFSAPQVAGSAALLLSTFYRRDTAHLMHVEPEDIQGILCASAWRSDADRDSLPSRDVWRQTTGWGHLDIGNAFRMMDTTLSINSSNYRLYHYKITGTPGLTFTAWRDTVSYLFYVPTELDFWGTFYDSLKNYRQRSYLLDNYGGRWSYMVQYRTVTAKMILPDTLERTDATPMFAWGRSGGPTAKSGWSLAQENFQSGFTEVINGTGDTANGVSQSGGYQEGIFHNNDTIIAQTYQYQVWGWDTVDGLYDVYLGHCPRDTSLGLNFSVFARPKIVGSGVKELAGQTGNVLEVLLDNATHSVIANYSITSPLRNARIEIYDALGRLVASLPHVSANIGWNQTVLPASALVN
ncbi:MAG TPA: S8 family serine peptidase, partial [Candidatus Kapabacteria bacterium]|nr:S8 family serine peptidase [Candidatus Kapabacteria bacterium]